MHEKMRTMNELDTSETLKPTTKETNTKAADAMEMFMTFLVRYASCSS
jgi:hypothetical protein